MNEKRAFCENCRDEVSYIINQKPMEGTIKGKKYTYIGKEARCEQCGSEIYIDSVNDHNLKSLYDEYRSKNDIISLEHIRELPKKYSIGKRPLSLILGWGELTFTRYYDGYLPTAQYSDILKRIYNDPYYYLEMLERNKYKLQTTAAYKKSKAAVEAIIKGESAHGSLMDTVIEYLLSECGDVTPLALQKALYYIQGFYYAFFGKYLFKEDCEAWVHGPVYREVYKRYSDYRFDPIQSYSSNEDIDLGSSERAILDSIIKNICCYSGKVLENFTHAETPWLITRGELPNNVPSSSIIEKELIGKYFVEVKNKYNMINPEDIEAYTKDMFKRL